MLRPFFIGRSMFLASLITVLIFVRTDCPRGSVIRDGKARNFLVPYDLEANLVALDVKTGPSLWAKK